MKVALVTSLYYQPIVGTFDYFDINNETPYYSAEQFEIGIQNYKKEVIEPFLGLLEADNKLKVTLQISAPLINHLDDTTLSRFNALGKSKQVEFLGGVCFDSLSVLFSKTLFEQDITLFKGLLKKKLGASPVGFLNAAMLYSEDIGKFISKSKYAYAIVPRIPWFIKELESSLFRSRSGELTLVLPEITEDVKGEKLLRVIMENNPSRITKLNGDHVLISEITQDKNLPIYHLPDLVAIDNKGQGIESLVGNNLQKDFLSRLSELCKLLSKSSPEPIINDLLWVGSVTHFSQLSNQVEVDLRYKNYTTLLNILYDLEVRLR